MLYAWWICVHKMNEKLFKMVNEAKLVQRWITYSLTVFWGQ